MRDLDLIRAFRSDVEPDAAARETARDTLRGHMAGPKRRRRPGRRVALSLAVLLVGASGATAAGLALTGDDVAQDTVACLDSASTLASHRGQSTFVEPSGDPVAACAGVWRDGFLDGKPRAVPALVACASKDDPVVVVPGDEATCGTLGLQPLPSGYASSAREVGRAKAVLWGDWDRHRPRSACDPAGEALAHARGLLDGAGVRGVRVELGGDEPCAGVPDLSTGGAVATIETLSRAEAADSFRMRRISLALERLTAKGCAGEDRVVARARRLLADAGLPGVDVRVEGSGCVDVGSYELEPDAVTFSAR